MADFINSFFGKEVRKTRTRTKPKKVDTKTSKKQSNTARSASRKTKNNEYIKQPTGSVFYKGYYFIDIKRSKQPGKRFDALFLNAKTGNEKRIAFGNVGEKDFIALQDNDQRDFYDFKYKNKQNWKDLMSRHALQKYILWNKGSMESSIRDYKKRLRTGR